MSNENTPRKRGRPRTKPPVVDKPKRPAGRPKKEFKDTEIKLDFKRPQGRPRKYPEGIANELPSEISNGDHYFKNGRSSVFNEDTFSQHLEDHQLLLQAVHRYFIEMEAWSISRSYNSSERLYHWIMVMLRQINIRRLQVKQFQNSRDPRFNPEVYRVARLDALARSEAEFESEMEDAIKRLREQAGLDNE